MTTVMNECFTVTPVTPTLATTAGADVVLGNPITDTATLTGTSNKPGTPAINPTTAGGPAGGTITFTLYGTEQLHHGRVHLAARSPVSGDGTYGPVSFTPTAVGTYHWAATYTRRLRPTPTARRTTPTARTPTRTWWSRRGLVDDARRSRSSRTTRRP